MDARGGPLRRWWLPAAVLAAGLAATALAGHAAHRDLEAQAQREFRFAASEIQAKLEDRVKDHEQVLWAGAGLFDALGEVERAQWRAWVERSAVQQRLPGLETISWVALVPGPRLQQHVEAVRREGFPDYRVWPEGARDAYAAVLYLEPFSGRNLRAFGFDDLSEPVRREALERARDLGVGAVTGRIRLVQEAGDAPQAGALMVVPVYRRGAAPATVEARRAALIGWVVGAYRMGDLMHGILGGWEHGDERRLRLALYDGDRADAEACLYDSAEGPPGATPWPAEGLSLRTTAGGRAWTLRFAGAAPSAAGAARVWLTVLLGAAFSLLLAALVASLQAAGRSARALADRLGDEVRSSRQWLELAVEAGGQGLWEWDATRDEVRFNERSAAMLGHAPGELDGPASAWLERIHPEDRQAAVASMERHLRGEAPAMDSEHRVRHRDGGWVWVLARGRVLERSADGSPRRAAGVQSDITALKQAHQAVQESEARFRRTADTAPVLIWSAGTDGGCDYFNRPWLDFVGRDLAQELGDGWAEGVHPDDLARCLETYRTAFQARRPFSMEYRLRRHDGEYRWLIDNGVPRFGPGGAFAGYIGACADITETRRAQQALQESVAALRRVEAAVEAAPASIVITDAAGRIEYVNPAFERTTGYARAEAVGQSARLVKSGQHDDAFYADLWATITAGRVWQGKIVNRTKAGALVTEQVVIAPVKDGDGAVRSYVAVKRDVSLELSLEQQLLQAQKLESVGRLAGGVAHDFNNLLTVILGCSGSLLADLSAGRGADRGDVEEIRAAGGRARDLTRQLLAFARKQVTSPIPLDLNESLRGCETLLRRTLGEDVELAVTLQPGLWLARCDPGQLEQVVLNLAINARDAMRGGGRLHLETSNFQAEPAQLARWPGVAPGPYVRLAVHDTGAGIPEAIRDQIFEPFFTTKEVGQGTGLGLATVYGIVRQSGGFIRVDSQVGSGTTFEILLPRTLEARPRPAAPAGPAAPRGDEAVLLVEDDRAVRETVARGLRAGGYRVVEVASGAEALAASDGPEPPRLLVTDVVLPGMDGRTVADHLRRRHPGLRVLFTSGYARDLLSQRGVLDPDVEFLPKPFAAEDLLARVRALLDRA